jgi:hypothetical protein
MRSRLQLSIPGHSGGCTKLMASSRFVYKKVLHQRQFTTSLINGVSLVLLFKIEVRCHIKMSDFLGGPPASAPLGALASAASSVGVGGSSRSGGANSPRSMNTLAREGLIPARTGVVAGSTFGQPGSRKSSNDQQRIMDNMRDNMSVSDMSSVGGSSSAHRLSRVDSDNKLTTAANFLPRKQWISKGEGWFQTTAENSGTSARCGLHSLIESSSSELFMCVYEPRTKEAYSACTASIPEFDLEVSAKLIQSRLPGAKIDPRCCFQIIFGFKSPYDYFTLTFNVSYHKWSVTRVSKEGETVLSSASDAEIKPNIFYNILAQIRGVSLSIDVNGVPVFTSLRITDGDNLSGLVGLVAKVKK